MNNFIIIYLLIEFCFFIVALMFHHLSNGEDRLSTPNTFYDRTWWKYTKLSTYYILFWATHIPWLIGESSKFRSLFKKATL